MNIFLADGAITEQLKSHSGQFDYDAFGHVKLDKLNPGEYLSERIANKIGAEKVLVQKSGYFARSSEPNLYDLKLIEESCEMLVDNVVKGFSGVIGTDLEKGDGKSLSLIKFERIKGSKGLDLTQGWVKNLINNINMTS